MIENRANELLRTAKIAVSPETFTLIKLSEGEWRKVLEDPAHSPRMTAPFMIFRDMFETTLMLDETDFANIRGALPNAKFEKGFRMLTFDLELDLMVTGFLAAVSTVLADAGVPIVALSAFSRDHILIKQGDLSAALAALRDHVDEIC